MCSPYNETQRNTSISLWRVCCLRFNNQDSSCVKVPCHLLAFTVSSRHHTTKHSEIRSLDCEKTLTFLKVTKTLHTYKCERFFFPSRSFSQHFRYKNLWQSLSSQHNYFPEAPSACPQPPISTGRRGHGGVFSITAVHSKHPHACLPAACLLLRLVI